MPKRFVSIWFRYLKTDWFTIRQPELLKVPFVLAAPDHGRITVTAANHHARSQGVDIGLVAADARAMIPSLQVLDDKPELSVRLLKALAEWCIRYTPVVAIDPPDELTLEVTGCAHLWGGEKAYLTHIIDRLNGLGYEVRAAMADTIGAARAHARFGEHCSVIPSTQHTKALIALPSLALRLEEDTIERLQKLGLYQIKDFIGMPRSALRRRFGRQFLKVLDQAIGLEQEMIQPLIPVEIYQERLPCLEPIITATGIEIALQRLLETLCNRLRQEQKGLRQACFKGYRVDGKIEKIEISVNRPSSNTRHLFKLFELRFQTIEPALGIELFILEAGKVEDVSPLQEKLWAGSTGLEDIGLSELIDKLEGKLGPEHVHRYLPAEHYWPERSVKPASSLQEEMTAAWTLDRPRPIQLLQNPESIEVTAPIPDYPPMLFRYKGKLHKINRADGPERIEQEWWIQEGQHRDYYCVEDDEGHRYWLFRSGHYSADKTYKWFIHGFFA